MPDYRRPGIAGGTYFITPATDQRQPWPCQGSDRHNRITARSYTMQTDHGEIILLAELPPRDQDIENHAVQLQCDLTQGKVRFYYQNKILRSTQFVQAGCQVMNSGTQDYREELHDQEEVPLKNLLELIERIKDGCVFHFEFDPAKSVWRGNLKSNVSGEVYNTVVYIQWRITLVLDLIHYTYEYDSYSYSDTST